MVSLAHDFCDWFDHGERGSNDGMSNKFQFLLASSYSALALLQTHFQVSPNPFNMRELVHIQVEEKIVVFFSQSQFQNRHFSLNRKI